MALHMYTLSSTALGAISSSFSGSRGAQISDSQKVVNLKVSFRGSGYKVCCLMEHLNWPIPANQLLDSSQPAGGRPVQWQSYCSSLTAQVATWNSDETVRQILQGFVIPEQPPAHFITGFPAITTLQDLAPPPKHDASIKVAYQGVTGAYSEAAVMKAYPSAETAPCEQFEGAFQAVESWVADRAVLPLENSLGGSIHRNYDLLLRHRLHIVGEVQLPVRHCLLALPGVQIENLRRVISHPQALAQCELTLSKIGLSHVFRDPVDDTAGAAEFIAVNGLRDTAAIASCRAAEIYGMNILANDIQDDAGNVTRFVSLARDPVVPRKDIPFKTSLVFSLEEGPGALFKVFGALSLRNINVTKIESRPQRGRPLKIVDDSNAGTAKYFQYLFYLDMEASMADPKAQKAVRNMQEYCSFVRVLGSYPMDMTPL